MPAEQGDFSRTHELLEVMRRPYDDQPGLEAFATRRPDWARHQPGAKLKFKGSQHRQPEGLQLP